ncbi:MAG: hypothetical protein LBL42_04055 [Tannerella sp.]|jgi:hypothetical protein|nr:hypothetical protein [Tannerella sp.]
MNTKKSILGLALCLSGILLSGCKNCGRDALPLTKTFERLRAGDAWSRTGTGTEKTFAVRAAEDRSVPSAAPEMKGTVQKAGFFGWILWLMLAGVILLVLYFISRIYLVRLGVRAGLRTIGKEKDEKQLEGLVQMARNDRLREAAINRLVRAPKRLLLSEHIQLFLSPEEGVTLGNSRKNYLSCEYSLATRIKTNVWKKTVVVLGEQTPEKILFQETTRAGWSLAALGRLITQNCTLEQFKTSLDEYSNKALPDYLKLYDDLDGRSKRLFAIQAELIETHERFTRRLEECDGEEKKRLSRLLKNPRFKKGLDVLEEKPDGDTSPDTLDYLAQRLRNLKIEIETREETFLEMKPSFEKGILAYTDAAGVLPFSYIMQVIGDSQNHFDRFIRQGAIMGVMDFLAEYRTDKTVRVCYEGMISARRRMISTDSLVMKFFEVRAPVNCTAKEYAAILKEVLRCANPDIPYGDMEKLMEIAEKEIPGVMDLLFNYPLRLIDPVQKKTTAGLRWFEPYRHVQWVHHTPPYNSGPVLGRFHDVLDLTRPNSSGLDVRLFTDSYAAIPLLFHEYCHYMEDLNEASVHLKTHLFSLDFYRRYGEARPEKDAVFTQLSRLLGRSPDSSRFTDLNSLIMDCYGKPKSREEAISAAKDDLREKNALIKTGNKGEKWHPEVKMPYLNKDGDRANAALIAEIVIRYAQVPRTVTQEEFEKMKADWMPVRPELYARYQASVPDMFLRLEEKDSPEQLVLSYPDWISFRDWCIRENHIEPYRGSKETPEAIEAIIDEMDDGGNEKAPDTMDELLRFNQGYRDMLLKFPDRNKGKSKKRNR